MEPVTVSERANEPLNAPSGSRGGIIALVLALVGAPAIWALHLLFSYLVVSLGCADRLSAPRIWVAALTVVAIVLVAFNWWSVRERRQSGVENVLAGDVSRDGGEHAARGQFLAVTGALLAVVFGIGILFTALPVLFVPTCG
jgi:hypothetical protein